MSLFMIGFIWVLNFGISWWNATAVGKAWVETKFAGGWMRFMAWCGATMAACGFTWCFLILFVFLGHAVDPVHITEEVATVSLQLGYVLLVPCILMSGYAIMFDSWARAWRERSATSMGIAGWNTFANTYNTYNAVKGFGDAFKGVDGLFTNKNNSKDNGAAILLVLVLVSVALASGILLTYSIIKKNAGTGQLPLPVGGTRRVYA